MRIVVTGTRGIPDIPGGVETHCEELYPRLAAMGHDVTVIRRTPYVTDANRVSEYRGVKIVDVYAPKRKSLEAIVHTTLAVIKARRLHADVLHIHAIGPALLTPLARLLGMKVVTTNHGPDYDRGKWGRLARTMLRTGERLGARWSHRVIVISKVIAGILADRYRRTDTDLIFNGVNPAAIAPNTDYLESKGIRPGGYILGVGRLVEEKGFHDLIEAYRRVAAETGLQLVIAGDADHPTAYSCQLKEQAAQAGVIMTGYIKGEPLHQVLTHARMFALPSYHEGLPIALLEAMSYGLDVAVSNIPACRLDCLEPTDFHRCGDVDSLAELLVNKAHSCRTPRSYDLTPYNWDVIARQTEQVYKEITSKP